MQENKINDGEDYREYDCILSTGLRRARVYCTRNSEQIK